MATILHDTFQGTGLLVDHGSDDGRVWYTDTHPSTPVYLNGDGVVCTPNSIGGFTYEAWTEYVPRTNPVCTVIMDFSCTWPDGVQAGFISLGVQGIGGSTTFGIEFESAGPRYSFYDGTKEVVVPAAGLVRGRNRQQLVIDFDTNTVAIVLNGNLLYAGPRPMTGRANVGGYMAVTAGPSQGPGNTTVIHRLSVYDGAAEPEPEPEPAGEFWTRLVKVAEIP